LSTIIHADSATKAPISISPRMIPAFPEMRTSKYVRKNTTMIVRIVQICQFDHESAGQCCWCSVLSMKYPLNTNR
jgi:hypothetical protein